MKMKRFISVLSSAMLISLLIAGSSFAAETESEPEEAAAVSSVEADDSAEEESDYPSREIEGIVPWGAGGQTDTLMRPLSSIVQTVLGQNVNVQNMAGNTGADGLEYVYEQDSDGYNLLMSAENPALYDVLGISDLTYDDFTCILLIGQGTPGVLVSADSPYASFTDLVNAALSGENITLAATGLGGLPWAVSAMIEAVTGAEFELCEYDGDASAAEAVLNGDCDFTVVPVGIGNDYYDGGDMNWLCMFADEPVSLIPEVPIVTDEYPDFDEYLPWGPFYGIFVKNDTDPEIIATLTDAYEQAYNDSSYQAELADSYLTALGCSGDEADAYIESWRETTLEALEKAEVLETQTVYKLKE